MMLVWQRSLWPRKKAEAVYWDGISMAGLFFLTAAVVAMPLSEILQFHKLLLL